jgi:hypothetical protein
VGKPCAGIDLYQARKKSEQGGCSGYFYQLGVSAAKTAACFPWIDTNYLGVVISRPASPEPQSSSVESSLETLSPGEDGDSKSPLSSGIHSSSCLSPGQGEREQSSVSSLSAAGGKGDRYRFTRVLSK